MNEGETLEPFVIGVSDEERRRRAEQQRRDDAARRAQVDALRAMQALEGPAIEPAQTPTPRADAVIAEAQGRPPISPMLPETAEPARVTRTPYAQLPGAQRMESGAVVLRGEPQTAETLREHQQARAAMAMQARPEAPTPRMDVPAVASGSDPQMRMQAPAAPPPPPRAPIAPPQQPSSPTFAMPRVDPRVIEDAQRTQLAQRAGAEMLERRGVMARKPERPAPGRMDDGLPTDAVTEMRSTGSSPSSLTSHTSGQNAQTEPDKTTSANGVATRARSVA
ncbi:hypothetical protein [Sandaracinus amylolyticus]|uniref:hypothetical protein n=1 Tax=Sandaracinus amylolyticus TaxID=927083 RepID=UPI001F2DB8C4|nr:hypothetical protein [Sandaracinus amylolyticus]UJR84273.1 Hypothetical protein I5071_63510 [Sandaracinus amylolyticus]